VQEVTLKKKTDNEELKENILLAHETLQQLGSENHNEFSGVVDALKKSPH